MTVVDPGVPIPGLGGTVGPVDFSLPRGFTPTDQLLADQNVHVVPPTITNRHTPGSPNWQLGDPIVGWVADILGNLPFPLDAVSQVFFAVVDWVRGIITEALSWVETAIGDVLAFIWDDLLSPLLDLPAQWIQSLWRYVKDLFSTVMDLLSHAVDWIGGAAGWFLDQLLAQLDNIWSFIEPFVDAFVRNVLAPIWDQITQWVDDILHAVADVGGWLWQLISDIASWVFDNLIQPVYQFILDAIKAALDGLGVAWDVLQAAWGWIVWFAEHTFAMIDDLISQGFALSATGITHAILNAIQSDGATIEEFAASFLR